MRIELRAKNPKGGSISMGYGVKGEVITQAVITLVDDSGAIVFKTVYPKPSTDKTVAELSLPFRVYRRLIENNILTVGQLLQKTQADLLDIRGFGQKSLNDTIQTLRALGLPALVSSEPAAAIQVF